MAIEETHAGMESHNSPCSGFVTVDDDGIPCAGFRQCSSSKGVAGGQPWDVPLELRCANNTNLTSWSDPIYLYDVFFYRALPYDPVRPWKDADGMWYSGISTDACNATGERCGLGGEFDMWRSPALRGPKAKWERIATPLISTNKSYPCDTKGNCALKTGEFVTSGYFGAVPGDPLQGKTRVFTANQRATTFYVGEQLNGSPLVVNYSRTGSVGVIDHGDYTMARTLGSDPNQVYVAGRRVIVGWIMSSPASQSLARDLTFSPDRQLLQQFVPELKSLRQDDTHKHATAATAPYHTGQQFEVYAEFGITPGKGPGVPAGEGWTTVLSKGAFGAARVTPDGLEKMLFQQSPDRIIRRECPRCPDDVYKVVYYRRLTPLNGLDLVLTLASNWTDYQNVLNTDFEMYSTLKDAQTRTQSARWMTCNYNDKSGVGAFRDCGPKEPVSNNWNSFSGRGGPDDIRFAVATSASPQPEPPAVPSGAPGNFGVSLLGDNINIVGPDGEINNKESAGAGAAASAPVSAASSSSSSGTLLTINSGSMTVSVNATAQGGPFISAPILPANATTVYVHAIIDHSIIEVIFNNQTAFTFKTAPASNTSDLISIYGKGFNSASLDTWQLTSANNLN